MAVTIGSSALSSSILLTWARLAADHRLAAWVVATRGSTGDGLPVVVPHTIVAHRLWPTRWFRLDPRTPEWTTKSPEGAHWCSTAGWGGRAQPAANLFLRKQPALYQERTQNARGPDPAKRVARVLVSWLPLHGDPQKGLARRGHHSGAQEAPALTRRTQLRRSAPVSGVCTEPQASDDFHDLLRSGTADARGADRPTSTAVAWLFVSTTVHRRPRRRACRARVEGEARTLSSRWVRTRACRAGRDGIRTR